MAPWWFGRNVGKRAILVTGHQGRSDCLVTEDTHTGGVCVRHAETRHTGEVWTYGVRMTQVLELNGTPVTDFSDPTRKVKWSKQTIYGGWVYGSLRTIAHLDDTSKKAVKKFGFEVQVIQGAYNTAVAASAGTHDYDAVLDVYITGVEWLDAQRFLRANGWGAWWRYPPSFTNHIHMISLGYKTRVGIYVPGQVDDYYSHRNGMVGHAADPTWHPDNIDSTIFDFAEWEKEMEADMPLNDKDLREITRIVQKEINEAIPKIVERTVDAVMSEKVNKDGATARAALRAAKATPALVKEIGDGLQPPVTVTVVSDE